MDEKEKDGEELEENNTEEENLENSVNVDNEQSIKPAEKTFTQAQVNRMMAREKSQGKKSVYTELGIKPNDKAAIQAVKDFIASQKTDEQLKAEDEGKILEAENRALKAEIKAESMMAGIQKQFVDDCTILVLARLENEENADLSTIIAELKTKYPVWFDEKSDDKKDDENKTGKRGTGTAIGEKLKQADNNKTSGIGARLAAQRNKTSGKKKSYWSN